jgi:hypothetical protein
MECSPCGGGMIKTKDAARGTILEILALFLEQVRIELSNG